MYLTDLAKILRAAGLTVVEVPGWQTRTVPGQTLYGPYGGLVHHTATSDEAKGDYPSESVITHGRSDLVGPLAQTGVGRSGTWYVIAAGYANHAGPVDDPNFANWRCIGVEVEHAGIKKLPRVQRRSLIVGCAALGIAYGIEWRGHKEEAYPRGRKIDPHQLSMPWLRSKIAKETARQNRRKDLITLPTVTKAGFKTLIRNSLIYSKGKKKNTLRARPEKAMTVLVDARIEAAIPKIAAAVAAEMRKSK